MSGPDSAPFKACSRQLFHSVDGVEHICLMSFVFDDRYGRAGKQNGAYRRDQIFPNALDDGAQTWTRLNFDSAINSFPEEYYVRTCGLDTASLAVELTAEDWYVCILRRIDNFPPQYVTSASGKGKIVLNLPVHLEMKPARLCVELHYKGPLTLKRLAWSAKKPADTPNMGISITTYNKQKYLLPNIDIIRQSTAFAAGLVDLLIVNNGDAIDGLPEDVSLKTLANVGGTGGFLAGYEYFADRQCRKFVIMDDDIALDADFVDRVYALSCLAGRFHIGSLAEILNIDARIVKEQGGNIDADNVFGLDLKNQDIDIVGGNRHSLYAFYSVQFSGWWSLLVHIENEGPGIPEGLFIKRDDIMFGFESARRGIPTLVFPNLRIAHGEEGAPAYYYFDLRNDLINRARNTGMLGISIKQLLVIAGGLFLTLRHDRQRMLNMALADFMKGPEALDRVDVGKKLAEVRKIAQKPVSYPHDSAVLDQVGRVSMRRAALSFLSPSAYKIPAHAPVITRDPASNAAYIGAYYEPIRYTDNVYRHTRHLSAIASLIRATLLIGRLALTRRALCHRYNAKVSR